MPDAAWKAWERRVAKLFGGRRRGPLTRNLSGAKTDIVHDHFAIECKLLKRIKFSDLVEALRQAERNAGPDEEPVAVVKLKNAADGDAFVIQRLSTFADWRLK